MESKLFNAETLDQLLREGIPGFGDAFVDQVMERLNQISPLQTPRQHTALDKSDQDKIKYSMLVQFVKNKSPKRKLAPISVKVEVVNVVNVKEIQNQLLNEKLMEMEGDGFRVTEMGQRFMAECENVKEK